MHREPLRDTVYWQKWLPYTIQKVEKREGDLLISPFPENWKKNVMTQTLYYNRRDLIYFKYSAGEPLKSIRPDIGKAILAWQQYNMNISTGDNKQHLQDFTDYQRVLTLISWAVIFGERPEQFEKIAKHIHSNGEDGLIEKLLSFYIPGRTQTDKLIYPKAFDLLFKATKTKGQEQIDCIRQYLSKWYANMKGIKGRGMEGYDGHKAKGEGAFCGYWSFEAAAVVYLYNIDDSSFKDMDFYPADMVYYAKTREAI